MKPNLPITLPPNPTPLPVDATGAGADSNSPAALATCAPDALLCPTRGDLEQRWLTASLPNPALKAWLQLLNHLAAFHPAPQRN